jgi:large subunit ribosomal protein L29
MKYTEVKDLTVDELRKREKKIETDLFELKMKHTLGQVANPIEIRMMRRDRARVKTAITAKLGV